MGGAPNEAGRRRPLSRVRERVRVRGLCAKVSEMSMSAADALIPLAYEPLPLILTFSRKREKVSQASRLTSRGA